MSPRSPRAPAAAGAAALITFGYHRRPPARTRASAHMFAYVSPMLPQVGPMLAHVGPMLA